MIEVTFKYYYWKITIPENSQKEYLWRTPYTKMGLCFTTAPKQEDHHNLHRSVLLSPLETVRPPGETSTPLTSPNTLGPGADTNSVFSFRSTIPVPSRVGEEGRKRSEGGITFKHNTHPGSPLMTTQSEHPLWRDWHTSQSPSRLDVRHLWLQPRLGSKEGLKETVHLRVYSLPLLFNGNLSSLSWI